MSDTTTNVPESKHSVLGASGASRWMKCPASPSMGSSNPAPDVTSIYAAHGVAAHYVGEECLKRGNVMPKDFIGLTLVVDQHTIEVDHEMAHAATEYVELCKALAAISDVHGVETQVCLDSRVPGHLRMSSMPSLFGTADFWAIQKDTLHVIDYKHGQGVVVEVDDNPQLFYYAAGVWLNLTESNQQKIKKVRVCVVQPRAPHPSGKTTRWQDISILDLLLWLDTELIPAAAETQSPFAPMVSGDHCRWCRGAVLCPQLREDALKAAQLEFSEIPPDVVALTDAELDALMLKAETMKALIDATRAEMSGRLDRGRTFEHWKLVEQRGHRAWATDDEDTLRSQLRQVLDGAGIGRDISVNVVKVKSPAQIEKLVGKKVFRQELGSIVVSPVTGTTLVRDTDARPAVKAGPQDEFDAVHED